MRVPPAKQTVCKSGLIDDSRAQEGWQMGAAGTCGQTTGSLGRDLSGRNLVSVFASLLYSFCASPWNFCFNHK